MSRSQFTAIVTSFCVDAILQTCALSDGTYSWHLFCRALDEYALPEPEPAQKKVVDPQKAFEHAQ
jgi:hypothetical protein